MTVLSESQLKDLLSRWQALRNQGATASLEALCEGQPEMLAQLRARFESPEALEEYFQSAVGYTTVSVPRDPFAGNIPASLIPGYEILERVGGGGMGVVYKARQLRLNRFVAIKLIRPDLLARADSVQRFRQEAEAVARLQHPNVMSIYDVGEVEGVPYLSLEYVPGGSLARKARAAPAGLPVPEAADLLRTLAGAVQHAHERGIIHRDLKPANVLLMPDGTAKVADFGLARLVQDDASHSSTAGPVGTPAYMAPEQAAGRTKEVGPAADVYALGAIFYELLTGAPPFRGENVLEVLDQVRSSPPVPPRRRRPEIPAEVEAICLKCLAKERGQRFRSARELAEALQHLQEEQRRHDFQAQHQAFQATLQALTRLEEPEPEPGIRIVVEQGDVLTFAADVVVLKYAQGLHGATRSVAKHLRIDETWFDRRLTEVGQHLLLPAQASLGARQVLFVSTPPLHLVTYEELYRFSSRASSALRSEAPDVRHLAIPAQGVDTGLDFRQAFASLLRGFVESYHLGELPGPLERITVLGLHPGMAKRMNEVLHAILPGALIRPPQPAGEVSAGRARDEGIRVRLHLPAEKSHVLVWTPPGDEFDDVYYYGVETTIHAKGFLCERLNAQSLADEDAERFKRRVATAALVVVDLTTGDPLGHFVLGFAQGLGRPTVVLVQGSHALKLPVPGDQLLTYKRIRDLEATFKKRLAALVPSD